MRLTEAQEQELIDRWSANPFGEARCPACGGAVTGGDYPDEDYGERDIAVPETLECDECGYRVEVRAVYRLARVEHGNFEYEG